MMKRLALPAWVTFIGKLSIRIGLCLLLALGGYLLLVALGTFIPSNTSIVPSSTGTTIYVTTNGFHTDVILPVTSQRDNCFAVLADETVREKANRYSYISYGWGDKDFYLQSYEGNFPSFSTILNALFVPGESLMHVTFLRKAPVPDADVKVLRLSAEQYARLVRFITASFRKQENYLLKLPQPGYGTNDFFYQAEGSYHLFHTCNAWTGDALREAGVKVSWWTPLESSVFFYLP